MTQLEDAEAYRDAVSQLRTDLWALHGALDLLESFVARMHRQADRPGDCRCAEKVFATIDGFDGPDTPAASVCKPCHDRWMACQPHEFAKPNYLMGR